MSKKRKKVVLFGATGMCGSMLYHVFKDDFHLLAVYRDLGKLKALYKAYGGLAKNQTFKIDIADLFHTSVRNKRSNTDLKLQLIGEIKDADAVVNAAGIINRYASINPTETFIVNSIFPHWLSRLCGKKLIHLTTDCVFSGKKGAPYSEVSIADGTDIYGITKKLGEPHHRSLVLRTSFIGPEIANFHGLYEWLRAQRSKEVSGYTNHYWNGITTRQLALILKNIITHRTKYSSSGLYHLFSTSVNKYELLQKIKLYCKVDVSVKPVATEVVDRRLATRFDLNKRLAIPTLNQMLIELANEVI